MTIRLLYSIKLSMNPSACLHKKTKWTSVRENLEFSKECLYIALRRMTSLGSF